jgi:hypothetical protein
MEENNAAEKSAINSYMKSLGLAYSQGGNVKYVNGFNEESGKRLYRFIKDRNTGDHPPELKLEWIGLLIALYKKTLLADKNKVLRKPSSTAYRTNILQKIAMLREGIPRAAIVDFLKETSALKSGTLAITDDEINQFLPG